MKIKPQLLKGQRNSLILKDSRHSIFANKFILSIKYANQGLEIMWKSAVRYKILVGNSLERVAKVPYNDIVFAWL